MKLKDYIFCDDIRFESRNKISLMGIFGDKILINLHGAQIKWPVPMRLAIFLRVEFEKNDQCPDNFIFKLYLKKNEIIETKGKMNTNADSKLASLSVLSEGLPVEPGEMDFKIILKKDDVTVFSHRVDSAILIQKEKQV